MKRILWFRRDLRIEDQPLLSYHPSEVLPIFIFDTKLLSTLDADDRRVGFIFRTLLRLKEQLKSLGLDLALFYGDPVAILYQLHQEGFSEVVASGDYDQHAKARDRAVAEFMTFRYLHDTYLFNPKEIMNGSGTPYKVYTPFAKKVRPMLSLAVVATHTPSGHQLTPWVYDGIMVLREGAFHSTALDLESLGFKQSAQNVFYESIQEALAHLKTILPHYGEQRDYPAHIGTSLLSLHLRFGTISIRECVRIGMQYHAEGFIGELLWREFSGYILFHFPETEQGDFKPIPIEWVYDKEAYERWCMGSTGIPLVDAGMRELVQTGHMHNRIRMVTASFLTKHLRIDWRWGEAFFAKHLLDYDAASNVLNWQWASGTGCDAQPYVRFFNPYTQVKKFDKHGEYIYKNVDELKNIDVKILSDEAKRLAYDIPNYPAAMTTQSAVNRYLKELSNGHRSL